MLRTTLYSPAQPLASLLKEMSPNNLLSIITWQSKKNNIINMSGFSRKLPDAQQDMKESGLISLVALKTSAFKDKPLLGCQFISNEDRKNIELLDANEAFHCAQRGCGAAEQRKSARALAHFLNLYAHSFGLPYHRSPAARP